ncbi:MAG: DUF4230 domain-containing protein [Candidatus Promineifilaceae bacterium]
MAPENPENSPNPLLALIQNNPVIVVIVLAILILISLISIGAMLRVQANAAAIAESTASAEAEQAAIPTLTSTPTPTATATPTSTPTNTPIPSPTPTFTPTPIIIDWQELGELETLEVTTVTVFEETNPRWWIVPDARVLVRVTGQANFGIDITLAQIEQLAESEGTAVRIVLPHATVTGVELVDAQVYDQRWFPNAQLGVDATEKALDEIGTWANEQENLLEIAETVGRSQLENFLRDLGFEEIEIVFE